MSSDHPLARRELLLTAIALLAFESSAQSSAWPTKPLRLVVSWPPGGSADVVARLVSERLSKRLAQPVVVENRPGAGGRIGAQSVARADPDGYTLLLGAPSELTIAAATVRSMPYDPLIDFQAISQLVSGAFMLVGSGSFEPSTVQELVAYAKSNPGKVNYASYGPNTTSHLYGEQFCAAAGINATHVPYRGGAPAWNDLLGGQVQIMFENAALAMPMVRTGMLKAMAVLAPERLSLSPSTPTMAEAGYPGIGIRSWLGLLAPAHTPRPIVNRLHDEVAAVLSEPDFAKLLEERGMPANASTPEAFATVLRQETKSWKNLVSKLGLKLE